MRRTELKIVTLTWRLVLAARHPASGEQERAPDVPSSLTTLTCAELKEINRELEEKSQERLLAHIHARLRDKTKVDQRESYVLCKYYGCRYPDDESKEAGYMRGFVKKYEEAMPGFRLRRALLK